MAANDTPKALMEALDLIRGTRGPKPGSLDVLESKQVSRVRTISKTATSSPSGIAEKVTGRQKTGELGLCFYVEKKIAKSKIKSNKLIPPVLSVADRTAVFTAVQEIGKVRPQINKRRQLPTRGQRLGRMACFA